MARVLIDTFFHAAPDHRLSGNIFTGGYRTNFGRYSPLDVYHPNGMSMFFGDLLAEHDVAFLNQPYCEVSLCEADILVIPNPDYPAYEGASPHRIDREDADALFRFLERGGGVLLLVNSFLPRSDFWEENFDLERVGPIFGRLGVEWDGNYMSDDNNILRAESGRFRVGYGQGGRVKGAKLPQGAEPLLTYEGNVFGFTMGVGAGRLAVIGDAGLVSNGLYGFPTYDNTAFLSDLIPRLLPPWAGDRVRRFGAHAFGHLSCAVSDAGISEALFRSLRKGAAYRADHHYRHLVWERECGQIAPAEALAGLPFALGDLRERAKLAVPVAYVPVCEGAGTAGRTIELNVSFSRRRGFTEYLLAGNLTDEGAAWEDIGADPAVFGAIGQLRRVNTVVHIALGVDSGGELAYASVKQGQIAYDANVRNEHYGYDILLASRNAVYSPAMPERTER